MTTCRQLDKSVYVTFLYVEKKYWSNNKEDI